MTPHRDAGLSAAGILSAKSVRLVWEFCGGRGVDALRASLGYNSGRFTEDKG